MRSVCFNIAQINFLPMTCTATQISKATQTDPCLSKIFQYVKQGWPTYHSAKEPQTLQN